MAVYPGATYRPLNQFSYQGSMSRDPLGLVLHVNDSNGGSLYSWIAGDNGMSTHWQVARTGKVEQYVDTANASWCQTAGNRTYFSVETEGFPNQPLTDAQVTAVAGIYAWLHKEYGLPFQEANRVGDRGLAWHGMGGDAWGGHPGCPGELRKAQRPRILALAQSKVNPPKPPAPPKPTDWFDDMATSADLDAAIARACKPGGAIYTMTTERIESRVRTAFRRRGAKGTPVSVYTSMKDALKDAGVGK